ncbi:hypothetical protein GDO86_010523 [Hymenochirus boettgeri]|uniref:bis(5'-adenosyl)-triphosphatase n=1 Tax=Hymenochirus boettgeri TaxID=247094 RepID=A0A8T2JKJ2_9PIPI|nr:hypothetical protein GDO86_010523 [Hymenochirus boettgeri]KAG8445765.1 hypothetical protein GDO86_010523 [Hymenochirus boettgeri]
MYKTVFILAALGCLIMICNGNKLGINSSPPAKLILVSFDGFRADYLKRFSMPKLAEFFRDGVLVEEVKDIFITKTFPNHYTLVTGLYAESHGIVANSMYDPNTKQKFNISDSYSTWWNEAVPIWLTNEEQGHKSGCAMWPGSDVHIHNSTPSEYLRYNPKVTFAERVNNITTWFTKANNTVNFATLYWEEPDASGHKFGPDDLKNMSIVLSEIDNNIGFLMSELKRFNLWDTVNVIITSDHGMAQCSPDRVITLDNCIDPGNYTLVDVNPIAALIPLTDPEYVYKMLKKCSDNMKVYMKEDIPDQWHYKHNSRIQPILLVADEGWMIAQRGTPSRKGEHGYDNSLDSMHPFLAGHGPAFRKGFKTHTINSVDVYPMMCHILGLNGEPNNGTLFNTKCLLMDQWCILVPEAIGIVIGVIMVLTTLTCILILLQKRIPLHRRFSRLQNQEDDDPLLE